MTEPTIKIVKAPMLDTGIGRDVGFKDDADLIAHAERERAVLPPEARALLDGIDRKVEEWFLHGR